MRNWGCRFRFSVFTTIVLALALCCLASGDRSFVIKNDLFVRNGQPVRILGGSLHYFRVHPQYWRDRLQRAASLGLNTVQFYVPWNFHEAKRGVFEFSGAADFETFVRTAQELGLMVMIRLGPYSCGEWDFGGFPPWFLNVRPRLRLRSSDPAYLALVDAWWSQLLPRVSPLLWKNGGPIIMAQIENEYGYFGNDKVYLRHLLRTARSYLGNDTVIYTTDSGYLAALRDGSLPGAEVYTAVDAALQWDYAQVFNTQRIFNAPGMSPKLTTEFYAGWLSHWGERMPIVNTNLFKTQLSRILSLNASLVFYMVHGGTNFGFTAGSNAFVSPTDFYPIITSYDYGAPVSEGGDTDTKLYKAIQEVFVAHGVLPSTPPSPPPLPSRINLGPIRFTHVAPLLRNLDVLSTVPGGVTSTEPPTMESLGQTSGFLAYRVALPPWAQPGMVLQFRARDRAHLFLTQRDGKQPQFLGLTERWRPKRFALPKAIFRHSRAASQLRAGARGISERVVSREQPDSATPNGVGLDALEGGRSRSLLLGAHPSSFSSHPESEYESKSARDPLAYLEIVVEAMGRVNFGAFMFDQKGILPPVILGSRPLENATWTAFPLPLLPPQLALLQYEEVDNASSTKDEAGNYSPSFFRASFSLSAPADTYLSFASSSTSISSSLSTWTKGYAFVNGVNLGAYWPGRGPQCTLYLPAPLLRAGENELVLLELDRPADDLSISLIDAPDFTCGEQKEPHAN